MGSSVGTSRKQKLTAGRARLIGAAVLLASTILGTHGAALAQEVPVFEYTPPLETLRNILIPESTGGAARKIVLPSRADLAAPSAVQPAAAATTGVADTPAAAPASEQASPPARQDSTAASAPSTAPVAAKHTAERKHAAPPTVGFRINFAMNSAEIPAAAAPFLDRLAQLMAQEPKLALVIEGHTDGYGGAQYNLQLSALRAQAVGLALVQRGVDASRLRAVGKGKSEPLVANPLDPQNRRVQFVRTDGAAS